MTTPVDVEIVRRRVRLEFAADRAVDWSCLTPPGEDVLNAISYLLPTGETFFVHSVAHYVGRITDPVLKEQAARFIHQEAMHTREHARFNGALRASAPFASTMERVASVLLGAARRLLPAATQLAITCALEHFTAMLAERLLTCRWLDEPGTDPDCAALWYWHAAEEIEHKAVCFDVYQHVVGRGWLAWLHRVATMAGVSLFAVIGIGIGFARARLQRGRGAGGTAGPRMGPLLDQLPSGDYLAYYRRRFHPWNRDDRALLAGWKAEHPGFGAG